MVMRIQFDDSWKGNELEFEELISLFPKQSILIVGDVMLDTYIWGDVRRISPEAPVPVVEARSRTHAPGGAANVASNVAALGGIALIGGIVGADEYADQFRIVLAENGVDSEGLLTDHHRPTTSKMRIIAHSQQIARVDQESKAPLSREMEDTLLEWVEKMLPMAGSCILSDYDKGVVSASLAQKIILLAKQYHKPVVVDPKGADFTKYRGASVITPNISEAERATRREIRSDDDIIVVSKLLMDTMGIGRLLLTRGAQGMSLFSAEEPPLHLSTVAKNVYDVTGAGDTVVSTIAMALSAGADMQKAAKLANLCAGIVVGKLGTARVSLDELRQELHG